MQPPRAADRTSRGSSTTGTTGTTGSPGSPRVTETRALASGFSSRRRVYPSGWRNRDRLTKLSGREQEPIPDFARDHAVLFDSQRVQTLVLALPIREFS